MMMSERGGTDVRKLGHVVEVNLALPVVILARDGEHHPLVVVGGDGGIADVYATLKD